MTFRLSPLLPRCVGWLALVLAWPGMEAAAAAPDPAVLDPVPFEIAPDVYLLRGGFLPGRQPDGNSVLLRGPDGMIVVDSGRHPEHAARIVAFAASQHVPVVAVVNSHWHLDHVGGNPALRAAYPALRVLGSDAIDAALTGFLARSRSQLAAMLAEETDAARLAEFSAEIARIDAGAMLRPDDFVTASGDRILAGRKLRIGFEAASVTAGDVWLFDPATRVLVAGDLVTLPAPFFDTACPPRWQQALARLNTIEFEQLVPGHGAPMTRAGFSTWRRAFDRLLACAATDAAAANCVDGWIFDAGTLLDGHPPAQTRGLVDYYLQQRLRGAGAEADCPAAE